MKDYRNITIGNGKRVHISKSSSDNSDAWTLCGVGGTVKFTAPFTGEIVDYHCKTCAAAWKQERDAKASAERVR